MMFVNEGYQNFKYLVGVSDNYIILTDVSYVDGDWQNPDTIDIIYQYLEPSFLTIESTRTYSNSASFNLVDVSDSFFARKDCLSIIQVQVILIFMILFFINGLTRFVRKGGVFFGN